MRLMGMSCVFPCKNIENTAEYYKSKLEFNIIEYKKSKEPFIIMRKDDIEIILLQSKKNEINTNFNLCRYGYDAYFKTDDLYKLQKKLLKQKVKIIKAFETTNNKDNYFIIEDIDGRRIVFEFKEKVEKYRDNLKLLEDDIKRIYKELTYIKLEFEFMKSLDVSVENDIKCFKNIEYIHSIINESLWYSIIMRIAKVWDTTNNTNSLLKIFNRIKSDPEMKEIRNIITYEDISNMQIKIENIMKGYSYEVEYVNLFIENRNSYFAHLNELDSIQETQEKYFIGRNRVENLIKILFESVESICNKLNIVIEKEELYNKLDKISNLEYPFFINALNNNS